MFKIFDCLNLADNNACYIKGAMILGLYQVTDIIYDCYIIDKTIGKIVDKDKAIGKIWYKCYSSDNKTIQTDSKICYFAHTKEDFEKYIQIFIENYKKAKIKLKKTEIEKDFK